MDKILVMITILIVLILLIGSVISFRLFLDAKKIGYKHLAVPLINSIVLFLMAILGLYLLKAS